MRTIGFFIVIFGTVRNFFGVPIQIAGIRVSSDFIRRIGCRHFAVAKHMINGSHNGDNYIAYTFYMINSGDDTISYQGEIYIEDVSSHLDEAIRVAVYQNGVKTVYGKTKSDGSGKESDCDEEFLASTVVMRTERDGLEPRGKDKYTIVIWLEGNDPDCTDDLIGGSLKLGMNFALVEST